MEGLDVLRSQIMTDKGIKRVETDTNHTQCPQCGKVYKYARPKGEGSAMDCEQHITGICSNDCWDLFISLPTK